MDSYELINNFVDVDSSGIMMPISDKAESRVSPMLFLRQVLILRRKENDLSASQLPTGSVHPII